MKFPKIEFPKIPLPGDRVLTGHSPAPPANAKPTRMQRFVSHLPLKVRARRPEEGGQRPRASSVLPAAQRVPDEIWSQIADQMDRPTWAAYRQVSHAAAEIAAVPVKSAVVRRRADLIPALTAYEVGGFSKLIAQGCGLGIADLQHLAANTSITSLNLGGNTIGDAGAQALAANTSITSLDLSGNNLGPAGRAALEAVRGRFRNLQL